MNDETSSVRQARLTGAIYLLYFFAGLPLMLRASLVVPGNAAATADRIVANELMYRITVVTDLVSYILYLGLAYLFYTLLRNVNRPWALMGTLFTMVGCIILIAATSALTVPLTLLLGNTLQAIAVPERQALTMLALKTYTQAFVMALFLFGVQWLIMGPLFIISRLIPKLIGYLLTAAGVAWLVFAVSSLIAPQVGLKIQGFVFAVGGVAEVALALWLLVKGVNPTRWVELQTRS